MIRKILYVPTHRQGEEMYFALAEIIKEAKEKNLVLLHYDLPGTEGTMIREGLRNAFKCTASVFDEYPRRDHKGIAYRYDSIYIPAEKVLTRLLKEQYRAISTRTLPRFEDELYEKHKILPFVVLRNHEKRLQDVYQTLNRKGQLPEFSIWRESYLNTEVEHLRREWFL